MTKSRTLLGDAADGHRFYLDADRLIDSRMLLQANSGGGKSWAIRRILEKTHARYQHIVLDPEGEFFTLREHFDYVLAGRGGDCPAEPRSAHLLARRLLELNVSTVIDLYELKAHERIRFVRRFLEALVDAPRALWHPVLVVVDEAHVYAPQKGNAESAGAVIDLMSRGRKRGYCGVLATQRIAKLHKDAAAEANNYLIGRSSLDVDMKRAADELGLSGREEQQRLRRLKPGEFFAFGPALCEEVTRVKVGPVSTSHPKAGRRAAKPAAPRREVKKILGKLADLPGEARQEAATIEDLQREVREGKAELRRAQRDGGAPSEEALERSRAKGEATGKRMADRAIREWQQRADATASALSRAVVDITKAQDAVGRPIDFDLTSIPTPTRSPAAPQRVPRASESRGATDAPALGGGCLRMLQVLSARSPAGFTIAQWATLAGLKRTGGTWSTYLSRLKVAGYVAAKEGLWRATEEGLKACGDVPPAPDTPEEILAMWKGRLGAGPGRMLDVVVDAPGGVTKAELGEAVGITPSGGTFGTYLSKLRANTLVSVNDGRIVAAGILTGETS